MLHIDEEFYFATAHAMWRGALPYVDIWDRKPIGLFVLYMPAAALPWPWGIVAYQAMAFAGVVATAALIVRMARRAGWSAGALPGGCAYIVWIDLAEGQGGQAPVFYNLLVVAAAVLIAGTDDTRVPSRRRAGAAMLLLGTALQVKYSVVVEGVFFGLWVVIRWWQADRRPGRTIGHGAVLAITALLPTIMVAAWYVHLGQWDAFRFANFQSVLMRQGDPLPAKIGNVARIAAILSPLVAIAIVGLRAERWTTMAPIRRFLFCWAVVAVVGVFAPGSWFDHYSLPAMVPLSICAAGPFGTHRWLSRRAVPILVVVAVGGQVLLAMKRAERGDAAQFAAVAQAVGRGPGCLFLQSGSTMLYAATDRCLVSRYVFPSHLGRTREGGAIGVDQMTETRRILAGDPAVVVMQSPYRGERADLRALVERRVAAAYRETADLPMGDHRVRVFALRQPVARSGPAATSEP